MSRIPSTNGAPPGAQRVALLVEDDETFRESLAALIAREQFDIVEAASLAEARHRLLAGPVDVAFVDLGLPDGHGLELMKAETVPGSAPDFVVISGNATLEAAVDALRQGALDFLVKPIDRNRLRAILANVERTRSLRSEVGKLRHELRGLGRFGPLVGRSAALQGVFELIEKVAPTRATVMITGESGTGKELVAETVHRVSPRSAARFLAINCGAIAPNVIESELFGHEKGSFTGADRVRRGYFEEASGGTLFLDEITEMPADLQVKLLRVIETETVTRVGASEPIPVDVRLVAASNRDPEKAIREGKLREDLYYRLNVFPIAIPPLREHAEDIELLANHFLEQYNRREGTTKAWGASALRRMGRYAWPGNVRELRNAVERAAIIATDLIEDPGLPQGDAPVMSVESGNGESLTITVGEALVDVERKLILATLRMCAGDKKEAAQRLGISLKTLYNRLNLYEAAGQLEPTSRLV